VDVIEAWRPLRSEKSVTLSTHHLRCILEAPGQANIVFHASRRPGLAVFPAVPDQRSRWSVLVHDTEGEGFTWTMGHLTMKQ
jgi:hypothetical protein